TNIFIHDFEFKNQGMDTHIPSRPVDREKAEHDLSINIKKATSPEETAPKQKHVRKCIVYTWDYHTSESIWTGLKVLPILTDEVQTFKALISVHKIIRDGYGILIRKYVEFLKAKLDYHRHHPEFNGNFDYEDYISLKNVDDPNEGYETINDLMNLQDQIDSFQKLVIAQFRGLSNNECRIASLVPLVEESHGIYKFLTSMLRAMHKRTDNDPPTLIDNSVPPLPKRPQSKSPAPSSYSEPEPIAEFWKENEAQKQQELERQRQLYEEQQRQLMQQRELELQRQRMTEMQRQRELEEQQRLQQERERLAREQLLSEQIQRQAEGRVAELERELLNKRSQVERDQMMLEQYDRRVKALENEMSKLNLNAQQQIKSKDEMIKNLQALAKLYSQLRQEHLDLISKFKAAQLKANSAQEAIDKMERMERDMRSKNLELADMIRERDRARHELDRLKSSQREDLERVKRDLTEANARADDLSRSKSNEISSLMSKFNKEKQELEDSIRQSYVDDLLRQLEGKKHEIEQVTQIDDSLYELESPMQAGNQNSTPEYTLSMIEKATTEASEFSSSLKKFLQNDRTKDHTEVIKSATNFSQAISDVLINAKGIIRLADEDDEITDEIVGAAKMAANIEMNVQNALHKVSKVVEGMLRHNLDVTNRAEGEIGNLVEQEMMNAAKVIEAATARIQALMLRPRDTGLSATELNVHDAILESALAVTNAIANLIRCATASQQEIVAQGRGSSSTAAFYKKNNRWTEGLISAAKAIAVATNLLIEIADGVIHGTRSLEQLIVASNEVAAATAQLVAASRVKADFMSKTQDRLEAASKAVTEACKALVKAVKAIAAKQIEGEPINYFELTPHDFKVKEMEQQVEILKLEKELTNARRKLAEMRKHGYHDEED
ncbi:11034_t:CDS:10, partial [Racocetra fulgida]